jgi:hypothetical protein
LELGELGLELGELGLELEKLEELGFGAGF